VQKLWNDTTHSGHHSQSKNRCHGINCGSLSDCSTFVGDSYSEGQCRIQFDGRSQKYKPRDSTHSSVDTLTGDERDVRKQSSHHRHGKHRLHESSGDGSESSSFNHGVSRHRWHHADDRYAHHHRHRRENHEHAYGHHFDGNKSEKAFHCDKHNGHRNCSSRRSQSHDNGRHRERYRNSSQHSGRRQGHNSRH